MTTKRIRSLLPTADEKAALIGAAGTDPVVLNSDTRLTNARAPTAHTAEGTAHIFPGGTTNYLREDGTWQAPTAAHPDLAAHDLLGLATQAELDAHAAAADPHTGYQRESEKGAVNGYASLDGSGTVPDAQIPAAIARDSELHAQLHRAAHISGGGDALLSTDLIEAIAKRLRESGGADLLLGSVVDGEFLKRSGTSIVSAVPGGGSWTTKIKLADQTNNTATLADDDTLQFNTVANTQYVIRLTAFFLTNGTQDSKYRLVHTGTTTRVRRRVRRTSTTDIAQIYELKTAFDAADVVLSTTGLNPNLSEEIILQVGASGGVFKLQWGQVTGGAGPTQCLEGSYLEYATT